MSTTDVLALVRSLRPEGARVLDAGCGDGATTVALTEAGYVTVGLDRDLDAIRQVSEEHPRIPFFLDDLTDLALPIGLVGRGFDLLLARQVLTSMSLGELDRALAGLASVAAPDGLLVADVAPGSVGTALRTAEKAGWRERARRSWAGAEPTDAELVLVLERAPEPRPSRLRALFSR